ncbi:MAG: MarR family transcriptional regulator [Cyclobacteriaceae bacterium]
MGIEQDVKQAKFSSEFQKAMVNILFTSSWLGNRNTAYFKRFDISPEQFNVLRILRGSHPSPMRLADIAERMIERNSNCTRLVEKLRQKQMVNRELCEANRRQVDISITSKGLKILEEIDQDEEYWTAAEKKITKVEARELNRILDKLRS